MLAETLQRQQKNKSNLEIVYKVSQQKLEELEKSTEDENVRYEVSVEKLAKTLSLNIIKVKSSIA